MKLIKNGEIVSALLFGRQLDATDETAIAEYCLFIRSCIRRDQHGYSVMPKDYDNFVLLGGDNPFAEQFGFKVPRESFSDDTIYIAVKGNAVLLDGGIRGKLYAVYEFLERFLGVRFYAPDAYKTPRNENIEIDDCEIMFTPKIAFRNLYSYDVRWHREYAARLRLNTENDIYGLKHFGGSLSWALPNCHTSFQVFFPPYDKEVGVAVHPEYYAWRIDQNKHVARLHEEYGFPWGEGEICWTNPEVIKILIDRLKRWILEEPEMTVFSVTQNDWGEYCQCEECQRVAKEHARDGVPALSAPIILAVNQVARAIAEWQKTDERVKGRTIYVETFAYNYTRMAPVGIKVEDNVIIRFCAGGCKLHKLSEDFAMNNRLMSDVENWMSIAKNIYIWEYMANACMPVSYNPYLRSMPERFKYFADKNIVGMFAQHEAYGPIGPFFKVNQYVFSKLLWDADIDFEKEYRECAEFYYGEAAPYLMEVQRRFVESLLELDKKLKAENGAGLYMEMSFMMLPEYYPDEFLDVADSLYKVALTRVKTAELKLRVRKEYWYLKFAKMYKRRGYDYEEMQAVLDEMDELGISFDKVKFFMSHYYGGKKDDLFLKSIEDRNRNNDLTLLLNVNR